MMSAQTGTERAVIAQLELTQQILIGVALVSPISVDRSGATAAT
jgi:hypothetical protein